MKTSKIGTYTGAFSLWLAKSQTFWSVFAAALFVAIGLFGYTLFMSEGSLQPTGLEGSMNNESALLTEDVDEIYPDHLIAMIDRMDADIDDEINEVVEPVEPVGEDGLNEVAVGENENNDDKKPLEKNNAWEGVEDEVFALQALGLALQAGFKPPAVAFKSEKNALSEAVAEPTPMEAKLRVDPFAPLIFDDGSGNIQVLGPDPIETDPTANVQFMGMIGDAQGLGKDAVAILRLVDGSVPGTLVMRPGDSFELEGEKATLEKVENERVLLKFAGNKHYVDLAAFVDTVPTTVGDDDELPPSSSGMGGPSGSPSSDGGFDELDEF